MATAATVRVRAPSIRKRAIRLRTADVGCVRWFQQTRPARVASRPSSGHPRQAGVGGGQRTSTTTRVALRCVRRGAMRSTAMIEAADTKAFLPLQDPPET